MVPLLLVAILLALSVAVLLFQGVAILFAYQMPRLDPLPPVPGAVPPSVSVVIAARNEELDLGACLDSLRGQDAPLREIVVVDGGSTDRTRPIALLRSPSVRLIDEPPLPEGWVGKNWALDQGSRATSGEWILFADADVRCHPAAVRSLLEWAVRTRADLASLAPTVETVGIWERIVLPFYIQAVLTYFRTPRVNRDGSRAAVANGQFFLVRRAPYEDVGGHAAIREAVLEDVRLAQRFRSAGYRLRIAWAPKLLTTRMYRDRAEMFEGLLKNVHGGSFSAARQVGFLALLVGAFWLPLAVLPLGLWIGSIPLVAVGVVLWVALFGKHVGFTRGVGGRAVDGLLYPLAVGYYLVLVGTSLVRGVRRRPIVWKGRDYRLET